MAATATRTKSSKKSEPAPKKKKSSDVERSGPELEIRYPRVMKPNRVYPLAVVVPKRPKDTDAADPSGLIVVRPIVPGALVTPAEQRLELAPGHQVLFYITPLARGRLPRVHLDVFAPNQPPEPIPLRMKSKTQRLALCLLALAILVPIFIAKVTSGNWAPKGTTVYTAVHDTLTKKLPPVPILNRGVEFLGDDFSDVSVAKYLAVGLNFAHEWLDNAAKAEPPSKGAKPTDFVARYHSWFPNSFGVIFAVLALVAWMFHIPRRKSLRYTLSTKPDDSAAAGSGDPVVLEPI